MHSSASIKRLGNGEKHQNLINFIRNKFAIDIQHLEFKSRFYFGQVNISFHREENPENVSVVPNVSYVLPQQKKEPTSLAIQQQILHQPKQSQLPNQQGKPVQKGNKMEVPPLSLNQNQIVLDPSENQLGQSKKRARKPDQEDLEAKGLKLGDQTQGAESNRTLNKSSTQLELPAQAKPAQLKKPEPQKTKPLVNVQAPSEAPLSFLQPIFIDPLKTNPTQPSSKTVPRQSNPAQPTTRSTESTNTAKGI